MYFGVGMNNHLELIRDQKKLETISENLPIYSVKTMHGNIKFVMYGDTSEFRGRTFHVKEPETLAWINEFSPEDVFWDIGANIGCYSLYAGPKKCSSLFF